MAVRDGASDFETAIQLTFQSLSTGYTCIRNRQKEAVLAVLCGKDVYALMEVIRHAELIVEWFLWTIKHTNRSLDNSNATFRPSRASSGIQYNKSKGGNLYTCAKGQ